MSTLTLERIDEAAVGRRMPPAGARRQTRRSAAPRPGRAVVRDAAIADAPALHEIITTEAEGHLLSRTLSDLTEHAHRFLVATVGGRIAGCAELAPLSASVAEVRSLVVRRHVRGLGLGRLLVDALRARAQAGGFDRLCAFTHAPAYFARFDFSSVPHASVPDKIARDCRQCPLFGNCGQSAMVMALAAATTARTSPAFLPML